MKIWKQKLVQMGAILVQQQRQQQESLSLDDVTHVFALNSDSLLTSKLLLSFKGVPTHFFTQIFLHQLIMLLIFWNVRYSYKLRLTS